LIDTENGCDAGQNIRVEKFGDAGNEIGRHEVLSFETFAPVGEVVRRSEPVPLPVSSPAVVAHEL
jgi:hypothetical protein